MSRVSFNRLARGARRGAKARTYLEPTCIYCGCTESKACVTALGPCAWLTLNRRTNAGVCSACFHSHAAGKRRA